MQSHRFLIKALDHTKVGQNIVCRMLSGDVVSGNLIKYCGADGYLMVDEDHRRNTPIRFINAGAIESVSVEPKDKK